MLALCIRRVSCNVACVSCNITGNTCNIKRNTCNITQNTCNITWNTSASVKYTKPTMLRSIRVIEVITHNITFPRITFRIFLPWVSRREVVNCGMGKITWFYFLDNHVHSALFILHFTFRIPHLRILPTPPIYRLMLCISAETVLTDERRLYLVLSIAAAHAAHVSCEKK